MRRVDSSVDVIGNISVSHIYDGPLPFEPWIDLEITYPLCGEVTEWLGSEAVIAWRRVHDKEALEKEILEADKQHFELMERLKEEENTKLKKIK